jgi:hypothetical protein
MRPGSGWREAETCRLMRQLKSDEESGEDGDLDIPRREVLKAGHHIPRSRTGAQIGSLE